MSHFYVQFEKRLHRTNFVVMALAVCALLLVHSFKGAFSLLVGGLISYVNFYWLREVINYLILKGAEGAVGRRVSLQYAARYALIGLTLYVTIRFALLDLSLFLAGLFSYVLAIIIESIFEIARSLIRVDQNGRT